MIMTPDAIALNRFGLGARPRESLPGAPQAWLLDQFAVYQASPAAWSGQLPTAKALSVYQNIQREVRNADNARKVEVRKVLYRETQSRYSSAVNMRLSSAIDTPAPFVERLVHFWANHFAVSADAAAVQQTVGAFELEAIRPHVLGRFEDMLVAVEQHPAMLYFLNQSASIGPNSRAAVKAGSADPPRKRGLNENLAREIFELHTLGVRSGYSQEDVTELARALTGWHATGAATDTEPAFQFLPAHHEPGARTVMGRVYPAGNEEQAKSILRDLASSPMTARYIATKLARHFVADVPPQPLIDHMAKAYLRSRGDLPTVYRALVESPDAWDASARKFKSPWEWTVSALRALELREVDVPKIAPLLQQLGQPVWRPKSPAGYDDTTATWATPSTLMQRLEVAQRLTELSESDIDPRVLATRVLPGSVSSATAQLIARAESPKAGLGLLLLSPEFLRR